MGNIIEQQMRAAWVTATCERCGKEKDNCLEVMIGGAIERSCEDCRREGRERRTYTPIVEPPAPPVQLSLFD